MSTFNISKQEKRGWWIIKYEGRNIQKFKKSKIIKFKDTKKVPWNMRWWPLPAIALGDLQVSPRKVKAPETCHPLRVFLQKRYKYTNTFMNICISTEETNKRQPKRATLL